MTVVFAKRQAFWISPSNGGCGWKMRKDAKKSKKSKTRNADGKNKKINEQTNNGKKSFFQVALAWLGPSCTVRVVNSGHRLLRFFTIL